jgi:predicted DNA-binding protein (MmcQ/YjbR family)
MFRGFLRGVAQARRHNSVPYLARAQWLQLQGLDAVPGDDTKLCIREAHRIVSRNLTWTIRANLGLKYLAGPVDQMYERPQNRTA